jgi:hypothetical protein
VKGQFPLDESSTLFAMVPYGFGTFRVLLTIRQPLRANKRTMGWNSKSESVKVVPNGILSWMRPMYVQVAVIAEIVKQAKGTGVPSKYLDLPVLSFGSMATVTLKRANRVRPQRT